MGKRLWAPPPGRQTPSSRPWALCRYSFAYLLRFRMQYIFALWFHFICLECFRFRLVRARKTNLVRFRRFCIFRFCHFLFAGFRRRRRFRARVGGLGLADLREAEYRRFHEPLESIAQRARNGLEKNPSCPIARGIELGSKDQFQRGESNRIVGV